MSDGVIGPDDDAWFIDDDTEQRFGSGVAARDDLFALTGRLEGPEHDEFGNDNRFYRFKGGRWHMSVLGDNFVSALHYPEPGLPPETIALLSAEGNVYIVTGGPQTRQERLVGAGLSSDDSIGIGSMERLRLAGDALWACGMGALLYRRPAVADAPWERVHPELADVRSPPRDGKPAEAKLDLSDVAVAADGTIVTCGEWRYKGSPAIGALLVSPRGTGPWIAVPLRDDVERLGAILIEGRAVLVAGVDILVRLDLDRLEPAYADTSRRMNFEDILRYRGEIYLSASQGMSRFDGDVLREVGDAAVDAAAPRILQELNGVLWVFGYDGVARFDGTRGETVPVPPVHR